MAYTSAIVAIVAAAAGTATTMYGQSQQAAQARAAGKYNQRLAENQALQAKYAAEQTAQTQRERGRRILGMQRSIAAGAGVTPEGSPLLVMMDTAAASELDAQKALYTGQLQSDNALAEGTLARYRSQSAARGYQMGSATTLLSGIGNVAGRVGGMGGGGRQPTVYEQMYGNP